MWEVARHLSVAQSTDISLFSGTTRITNGFGVLLRVCWFSLTAVSVRRHDLPLYTVQWITLAWSCQRMVGGQPLVSLLSPLTRTLHTGSCDEHCMHSKSRKLSFHFLTLNLLGVGFKDRLTCEYKSNNAKALWYKCIIIRKSSPSVLHKGIYMILLELHSACSNQPTALVITETSNGRLRKLFAPPLHCFSAASLEF